MNFVLFLTPRAESIRGMLLAVNNCQIGFDLATGGTSQSSQVWIVLPCVFFREHRLTAIRFSQTVGAMAIIDATVANTPIFIRNSNSSTSLAGSLVLNNVNLQNVPTAVGVVGGEVVLPGGTTTIESWGQGNVYNGSSSSFQFMKANIPAPTKDKSLLDSTGKIFGRARPQYEDYAVDQFVSVKSQGAKGDGKTDDTAALQAVFDKVRALLNPTSHVAHSMLPQFSGCKIIFLDAGYAYQPRPYMTS